MRTPRKLRLNASTAPVITDLTALLGSDWTTECTEEQTSCTKAGCPRVFIVVLDDSCFKAYDQECEDICTECNDAQAVCDWMDGKVDTWNRVEASFKGLQAEGTALNSALSAEASQRIKNVFKMAQEAVEMPKGFRYTAFRENKSENMVLSTLMYTSAKLGKTQWVVKSALMAQFVGEEVDGSRTGETVTEDAWAFQPNYDPDRGDAGRDEYLPKSADKLYNFVPNPNSSTDPDRQAAYWLVGILSDMLDDILNSPPNRVYEFFLADGLLKKKNLAIMEPGGLIRLLTKGVITGPEVLKAKPSMWKKLLERGFITGEQAYKSQPSQLAWLTIHDYIPVERALKIDPNIQKQLERYGKMGDATPEGLATDVNSLVQYVTDGVLTPQKAWSLNSEVLKPLVEAKLITPYDAYRLDPSILNWMLENHHIGRAEATKLKPRIKQEMDRKGVDWETLEASTNASRKLNADYDYPDEDGEDVFYVAIDDDLIIKVEKHDGRWYESVEWEGEDAPEFKTATYMGYLTHNDIKTWIRRDFPNAYIRELNEDEYYDFIEEQEYDDDYDGDDWEDLDSSRHLNASTYEELLTRFAAGEYIDDDVSLYTNAKVPMSHGAEPVDTVYLRKEPGEQGKILGFAHNNAGGYSYDLLEAADVTNVDLSPYMDGFDITNFKGLLDCLKAAGILRTTSERNASRQSGASSSASGVKPTRYYYDPDDKKIKEGDFKTIAVSKATGKVNEVQFEYDPDDNEVVAIVNGKRYRKASLEQYFELREGIDSSKKLNSSTLYLDPEGGAWEYVRSKDVLDFDGFNTTYTWFQNEDGTRHIFMLTDDEPDPSYADFECESYEEAREWFESYEGFEDLDSSKRRKTNAGWEDIEPEWHSSYPDWAYGDEDSVEYEDRWEYIDERWVGGDDDNRRYTLYGNDLGTRYIITYDDSEYDERPSEDNIIEEFSSYEKARSYFNSLNSSKNLNNEQTDLDSLIQTFAEHEGKPLEKLDRIQKRLSYIGEFDNGRVLHGDWAKMSVKEAEEKARQASIAQPDKVFFVSYDDVMIGSSDIRWQDGKAKSVRSMNSSAGYEDMDPDTFRQAVEMLDPDSSAWDDLDELCEIVGYYPDDVGGWDEWFSTLEYDDRCTAWDFVSWVLEEEDFDSSKKLNCSGDESFYVSINMGEMILRISKSAHGEWAEEVVYRDEEADPYFVPSTYMGYLSPNDILSYLKSDFSGSDVNMISEEEVDDFLGYDDDWDDDEDLDSARRKFDPTNINDLDDLKEEVESTVYTFLTQDPMVNFDDDFVKEYSAIEITNTDDGRVRVEVRADISFDNLMRLADRLNKIVTKIDKESYFDAVEPGILDAYIGA